MDFQARVEAELAAWRAGGGRVLGYVGATVPVELVAAAGFLPYRLAAEPAVAAHPDLVHQTPRVQSLAGQILAGAGRFDAVVVGRGPVEDLQLFAVLRELGRLGRGAPCPVANLDMLTGGGEARARYNAARLAGFQAWLAQAGGRPPMAGELTAAAAQWRAVRARLRAALALRREGRLSGVAALELVRAVSRLPAEAALQLLETVKAHAAPAGRRVVLTGSAPETSEVYAALEAAGLQVVGEDHDRGEAWAELDLDASLPPLDAILKRWETPLANDPRASSAGRAEALARRADACGAEAIVLLRARGDEAAAWDGRDIEAAAGRPVIRIAIPPAGVPVDAGRVAAQLAQPAAPAPKAAAPSADPKPARKTEAVGRRSRKSLASTAAFGAWQRDWFAAVREQSKEGPFAVVNADAPQEILRTLGVPYVINQWWASIVGAKQHGRVYGAALRAAGYPHDAETYSAQGLAAALAGEAPDAPWGGLPKPDILALVAGSDAGLKIYEAWARQTGAELLVFDRTAETRADLPLEWWNDLPNDWARVLEPERLDLFEAELWDAVARLETITGRTFDRARFVEVMRLVNEQEDYYRRTRDLIAATHPAPISIVDSMPATMVPQWHRGSEWGRDAARQLYEEVQSRAAAGEAACPGEKIRLLFVGRGLWSDMGFYQKWEESHGAVFVWSMYLGLAADGYIREFEGEHDAMRALAARFVTMGDELRMPTWAGAWHVKEAKLHGCHGAVAIDDADPFVLEALEAAGIPVCRLALNNMSVESGEVEGKVTAFLDGLSER